VEWAHAIAPQASILLVETSSSSLSSLFTGVNYAAAHAHVVSLSWGTSEFTGENSFDSSFNKSGVTFTAAAGDSGTGVIYPAASPYVLAVGGTTLSLDASGNRTAAETAWNGSGGGISGAENEPGYQANYPIPATGGARGVPDVAYDADPNTGFYVYDTTPYYGQSGWFIVGGTSAGAPQWAALTALANQGRVTAGLGYLASTNLAASAEYNAASNSVYGANYHDVTAGSNGTGPNTSAAPGYDFVTGLGSPVANNLVVYLQTH
jgi:subtilase family serine protease